MNKDLNKLTKYFIESNKIDENTEYEIMEMDVKELLVSNRIDLIAKLKYIENKEKRLNNEFLVELYKRHLEAFSNGAYIEPGKEEKNTFQRYCDEFDSIIESIKENGFDDNISLIPVGEDNTILDGAHRVAACIYFDKKVKVIKFKNLILKCDINFFKKQLLEEEYLEYLLLEYARLKNDLFVFCLWPKSYGEKREQAEKIIEDRANVLYKKEINLSYTALKNFMIQAYKEFDWVGDYKNNFKGVYGQLDNCYKENANLKIIVIENDSIDNVLGIKKIIRELYGIGNYSIHSTDNSKETLSMLKIILNRNSINLLNLGQPSKFNNFYSIFIKFKEKLEKEKMNIEEFCIDSSGVLALYGIRETNDIDFISTAIEYEKVEDDKIENHHNYLKYYEKDIQDILMNPNNYLYYDDIKFISLELVKKMKNNRNEPKDKEDVKMINSFLKVDKGMLKYLKIKNYLKRKLRNTNEKIVFYIKKIFKKIGIFDFVKKIYRKIFPE